MQKPQSGGPRFFLKRLSVRRLCLLAFVVPCFLGQRILLSPLPRGAYPVLSTSLWAAPSPRLPDSIPCQWLPNGDLVHLERGPHGTLQICYQKVDADGRVKPLRRGLELPLPPTMPSGFQTASFSSSPDEKWIACQWNSGPTTYRTLMVSADGKITRAVPKYFLQWLSDSRSFLALSLAPMPVLNVCHLDSSRSETIPRLTRTAGILSVDTLSDRPEFLIGGRVLNLPPPAPSENYPNMTLRSFRVSQPDVVQRTWRASVPTDIVNGMAFASPDHKHLLWLAGTQTASPVSEWLHRLFPAHRTVLVSRQTLYLSDMDGKNMHPVLEGGPARDPSISGAWTPDSKHLSFIYKNQLYLVPVD